MPRIRIAAAAAVCAGLLAAPSGAQHGAPAGEWPSYGGDVGSTKYSPLDQIDAGNFGQLENVWRWRSVDGFLSKAEAGGEDGDEADSRVYWGTGDGYLIAVDARTGRPIEEFGDRGRVDLMEGLPRANRGERDYDFPAAPTLIDLPGRDGADSRKIVAQVSKQGFLYVFDRVTGKPVWPIEDRPAPPATMPGDTASPTQPFPTRPAPFEYQGVTEDDLADFTPEIRQMALDVIRDFEIGPLFTPPSLPVRGGKQGTIFRPSAGGGANWYGAAVDPETGWLYVPSRNMFSMVTFYTPDPLEGGTLRYTHGGRGRRPEMPEGLPLFKPPYTRMTAIDLNTGEHVWMKPLGNNDRLRRHPRLEHLDLPPLGGDTYTGPLLTRTLLIHGQHAPDDDGGNRLVARDKRTGDMIAEAPLPARGLGTPMTYLYEGRQYIALTVAGRAETDFVPELLAFALP